MLSESHLVSTESQNTAGILRDDLRAWKLALECESQTEPVSSFSKGEVRVHPVTLIIPQRKGGHFTPVILYSWCSLQDALPWKISLVWCVQNQNIDSWDRQSCWVLSLPPWSMLCFHKISSLGILIIAFSVAGWLSSGLLL